LVDCISVSKFIISANNQSNKKVIENFGWNKNEKEYFSMYIFI
jgi:hypothetical protein